MNNALLTSCATIAKEKETKKRLTMPTYVDLSSYWKDDLSINEIYEKLLIEGKKIDRRTLTAAKKGTLTRSEFSTLENLKELAKILSGKKDLSIEDILVRKED